MPRPRPALSAPLVAIALAGAAPGQQAAEPPMFVAPRSDEPKAALQALQLAPGLQASLVAAEPDLCNVVAFSIDAQGRIWVSETFRINDGVFDTRNYMEWKDEDLACTTVADRLAKYGRHLAADIPRYAAYSERVQLLADTDGDGVVDRSTVFADGFDQLADGIAAGVLHAGADVWFACIPALWRLGDRDGDGRADRREAVFEGFGVHTSLIGHDLHGLIVGPDRRLWFSIGDRGLNVTTKEGRTLAYPHEGAVLRCELDGSGLEVVHRGLRNPQELAFDDFGDLFTGDNNSDGGDRARLVQVVDGADSGWRIGYQWLDDRGAWNRERLWWPRFPGQPAASLPPILNVADGPSGLAFDPGVGLPERYRGCLFLCDFRGGAAYSGVHALRLLPAGAGFELDWRERPVWGVLCTDLDFGPDGALYVSDWVSGWTKTGKGRIYRIDQPGQRNDLQLRANARLVGEDLSGRSDAQLATLLAHRDRRVRQAAEFALVDRDARATLLAASKNPDHRLARLHAIWGLGILGRKDAGALTPLLPLLRDGDAEVRAATAKVLGEARHAPARAPLLALLQDGSSRVRCQAALALGRLGGGGDAGAVTAAACALLADNDDRDPVLRHAGVMALCGAAPAAALRAQAARPAAASRAVRLGALLALRRLSDPGVADFLADPEPSLRAEAARAIHDGGIDAARPALAAALETAAADDEAFAWRALNAARLAGTAADARRIAAYARGAGRPAAMRVEAVRILAEWRTPHGQDRITGLWRPCRHADVEAALADVSAALRELLAHDDGGLAAAAADACGALQLPDAAAQLAALAQARDRAPAARVAALQALDRLGSADVDRVVASLRDDDPVPLREAAVRLFAKRSPAKAVPVLATLCRRASLGERQAAFAALGELQDASAAAVLADWLAAAAQGRVDAAVQLDLLEAAGKRKEPEVASRLQALLAAARDDHDPLAGYRACLDGGDAEAGRRIFFDNEATRCTRCHTVGDRGGSAGPKLDGIGSRQPREYLLESLVRPGAKIAAGFATTVLTLHSGDVVAGVLVRDQDGAVAVMRIDGETQVVPWDRIKSRVQSTDSAMPVMAGPLDKRQLRDVVAFLAGLHEQAPK